MTMISLLFILYLLPTPSPILPLPVFSSVWLDQSVTEPLHVCACFVHLYVLVRSLSKLPEGFHSEAKGVPLHRVCLLWKHIFTLNFSHSDKIIRPFFQTRTRRCDSEANNNPAGGILFNSAQVWRILIENIRNLPKLSTYYERITILNIQPWLAC